MAQWVGRRRTADEKSKENIMTRFSTFCALIFALALLATSTSGASAQLGAGPPPPPRIVIRAPTIAQSQQPSLWGVNTTLEHNRDRWQRGTGEYAKTPKVSGYLSTKYQAQ
jgi:hypothetical protein